MAKEIKIWTLIVVETDLAMLLSHRLKSMYPRKAHGCGAPLEFDELEICNNIYPPNSKSMQKEKMLIKVACSEAPPQHHILLAESWQPGKDGGMAGRGFSWAKIPDLKHLHVAAANLGLTAPSALAV